MPVCRANWFLAKSACQEPTDRTHEHNLQAVLFIITSTIWRLGSTKLQQFAAMFALVDSLRPHEYLITMGVSRAKCDLGMPNWQRMQVGSMATGRLQVQG